ncbi:MAG: cupin domain-containing protein [Balneolaceae bacterium]|nr:cupin domain-containing protein [Balneolaceae bacterium]
MNHQERIEFIVNHLELRPHPEGGFYKESYRSEGSISAEELGKTFNGARNYATGIYFLLTAGNFSAFHRIKQDEMWHFYEGDPLRVHMIDASGNYSYQDIGLDFAQNQRPQIVVPAGVWFASEVVDGGNYSLVGCTVSPGFDFEDFELAKRERLVEDYPMHKQVIEQLTR